MTTGHLLGIDTGGTFTDLAAYDPTTGAITTFKTPSVPSRPGQALLNAIEGAGLPMPAIGGLVHGTTVATNALIERTGARVGFLVTAGHEDIPYIQRINRKTLYDLFWQKPKPLLRSRRDSLGVPERLASDGRVLRPLDEEALACQCRVLKEHGVEAVAICLLFAYVNPEHEARARQIVERELPGIPISVSHEIAPIWREYERASTTIADAYLKPLMRRYVGSLTESLAGAGLAVPWTIMKSNGGAMLAAAAAEHPIQTAQSGPAGGMLVAAALGRQAGEPDLLTLDMGGTSADVGIIRNGEQRHTTEYEIEWGVPAAIPLIDIKSIGAGGGSIAWIDAGGFLRVGPQSAGASPGPACYGQGGTQPTVTDANLVLGRLDPGYFLGGRMQLDVGKAESALAGLAAQTGTPVIDLASSIVEIANENMASAIKMVSIERGHDPRHFALFAFGGAGPLHAAAVARSLRIPRVLVPLYPGNASALGMLIADLRVDKIWTQAFKSNAVDAALVERQFVRIRDAAVVELRSEGYAGEPEITYSINMRYLGQNYEQEVPIPSDAVTAGNLQSAYDAFVQTHEERYGYAIEDEIVELVSFRVVASGRHPAIRMAVAPDAGADPGRPGRNVHFRGHDFVPTAIYLRYEL
ncbi:MAG TPA: hydantoinase/oxoprolinase family protein, partial [Thermomicrobiales bacterium]|nr:hydantoinase/oxoprolinase family protein [Thermomicrobiales bacterium]